MSGGVITIAALGEKWLTFAVIPRDYCVVMTNATQIRFAPAVTSMRDHLEPYLPWLEKVVGCSYPETLTFETEWPIGRFVIGDLLKGVSLDEEVGWEPEWKAQIDHWELASETSPRISLTLSRKQGASIVDREAAWQAQWRDCPIAVWMKGERKAFVVVNVPYVSFSGGLESNWGRWLIVNRESNASVLNRLALLMTESSKPVNVFGGRVLSLTSNYDWGSVVLDAATARLVRDDFESFFKRERWFREHGLPFRRGYLLYGPPGNGKTTAIKVMAAHPAINSFTLDFCDESLNNGSLTDFFATAARNAPALIIFEDLDRAFEARGDHESRLKVTVQHFLNCLDGIGTQDGVIVVATASDPSMLDAALLKRPGRFDRVVAFRPPERELCVDYLHQLSRGELDTESLKSIVAEAEGLSFAQLRESYILAGQLAFDSESSIGVEQLREGITSVRGQMTGVRWAGKSNPGFRPEPGLASF